jgi:hypothetical protein
VRARPGLLVGLLFLTLAPLAAHLAFSGLGHNPTDDGFILAYSRRILDGEVPHRDFVSVRPVGSALLHAPEVALGGASTLLLSRFVVLVEFALLAWAWVLVLERTAGLRLSPLRRAALATLLFAFNLHTFPLMPWHTVDGLLFLSLGLVAALDPRPGVKLAGYALVGAAALFKQNFLFFLPVALAVTGDWRRAQNLLAGLAPAAAYALVLLATGAFGDGLLQMRSLSGELPAVGIAPFLLSPMVPWGILAAGLGLLLASGRAPFPLPLTLPRLRLAGVALLLLLVAGAAALLATDRFPRVAAFVLFGAAAGVLLWAWATERHGLARFCALALAAGWTASLSFGYTTPALVSGVLAAAVLAGVLLAFPLPPRRAHDALLAGLLGVVLVAFVAGRVSHVYREPAADALDAPLDDLLPGGSGIRASAATAAFYADLQNATREAGNGTYAVLPDAPAWWIRSEQPNPLPIDWPLDLELNKPELMARVTGSLDAQRGNLTAIVQKVRASDLAAGLPALAPGENQVVDHVRGTWQKVGETEMFEIYR